MINFLSHWTRLETVRSDYIFLMEVRLLAGPIRKCRSQDRIQHGQGIGPWTALFDSSLFLFSRSRTGINLFSDSMLEENQHALQ
jgi:hypothetical protein